MKSQATPGPARLSQRIARFLLLALSGTIFAFHYLHLSADFPNFSPWMDWSKYTDEGWYGDAAIRHFQLGHWYVPGDFNPAAALPVWPLLEGILFRFTGVSLVAARALTVTLFGGILVAVYFLLRRWSTRPNTAFAPEVAVLLLVVSPFCFVFTRLAILEPLLVLITLLLLLVAGNMTAGPEADGWFPTFKAEIQLNFGRILALGALLPLLVLTKTTGLFLIPSVMFLLFAALGYRTGPSLRVGLTAAALACALWLSFFYFLVRPRYLLDYRYLFSANGYTGITPESAGRVITNTIKDGAWIGRSLYYVALGCTAISAFLIRRWQQHPLIPALLLWAAGYSAFLAYHDNLQPRYYLVIAIPLTLIIPAAFEELLLPRVRQPSLRTGIYVIAALATATIAGKQAIQTAFFLRHPQYTMVQAARHVQQVIQAHSVEDPRHNQLVLSISGSDLSLMTGLPSICDDFGTLELVDRVKKYRPGWYVAWNQIDDDKMDALTPYYHIERVAAFPAMDSPDRNLLIVYRLDNSIETPPARRHRNPPPKALVTRVGQQPSTNQLEH